MVFEYDHLIRQIYTDGREHPLPTSRRPRWATRSATGKARRSSSTTRSSTTTPGSTASPCRTARKMRLTERIHLNDARPAPDRHARRRPDRACGAVGVLALLPQADSDDRRAACEDNATYAPFEEALLEFDGEGERSSRRPRRNESRSGGPTLARYRPQLNSVPRGGAVLSRGAMRQADRCASRGVRVSTKRAARQPRTPHRRPRTLPRRMP